MGSLFDWLKRLSSKKVEVEDPVVVPVDPLQEADMKRNIVRMRCPACNHKKARKTNKGQIQCRRCKTMIG